MNVSIKELDRWDVMRRVAPQLTYNETLAMNNALIKSHQIWLGLISDEVACVWGLVSPTLLSVTPHLWLYTTPLVRKHRFIFVRHSQRVIEDLLRDYPEIVGVTRVGAEESFRWIKWLGGVYGEPQGRLVPFVIRRRNG